MSGKIKLTDAGLRYLELEVLNKPSKQNTIESNTLSKLPALTSKSRKATQEGYYGLSNLSKYLNRIHTDSSVLKLKKKAEEAEAQSKFELKKQMLKDLSNVNKYTEKKASEFAQRLFKKIDSCDAVNYSLDKSKMRTKGQQELQNSFSYLNHQRNQSLSIARMNDAKQTLNVEVSKSRNYLARIDNLHRKNSEKYDKICEKVRKVAEQQKNKIKTENNYKHA